MKLASKLGIREYVFISMLFVIPAVMVMCVLSPRSRANAEMRRDSARKSRQLDRFERLREKAMPQLRDDIVQLEQAGEYLQDRVPRKADIEKTIGDLSRMARENGLRTKNIQARPAQQASSASGEQKEKIANTYEHRDLTMEVKGPFPKFYAFLQAVENYPRIIHVDRIRLFKLETQGDVRAKLRLRIFFQAAGESKQ